MWQHKVFVVFERTDKEPVLLYPTPPTTESLTRASLERSLLTETYSLPPN